MKRRQGYSFRLNPKPSRRARLNQALGANRWVWNRLLAMNGLRLQNQQPLLWYHEMDWFIKLWKKSEEYGFLSLAPAQSLQQTAKALDRAFHDAFDKKQPGKRLPVFKKRGKNEAGIRYPQHVKLDANNSVIQLPKLGWVKYRNSRPVAGDIKNVTVSRKAGHYTVSIQTEREVDVPVHSATSSVGIDMGIVRFATLSDGSFIEPKNSFKRQAEQLANAQRKLARQVKFSANWHKQQAVIARQHHAIANVRNDFLHQASTRISKNHAMIMIEDLKISNMSKSAAGTTAQPGKRVAQKRGLNRAILDQGWGEFRRQLEYKQQWRGGWVLAVPPQYSSQECPQCHYIHPTNRISQKLFRCGRCQFEANADFVGSVIVQQRGLAILAGKPTGGHPEIACEVSGVVKPPAAGTRLSVVSNNNAGGILAL